jgi:hypothetical protein
LLHSHNLTENRLTHFDDEGPPKITVRRHRGAHGRVFIFTGSRAFAVARITNPETPPDVDF